MTDVSDQQLSQAQQIGQEIREAFEALKRPENKGRDVFELAPKSFQDRLSDAEESKLKSDIAQEVEKHNEKSKLLGGSFGCSVCTTLTYSALVAALGASVIASGGMSIPAVLAASGYSMAGLATVIAALTGVSAGAITAMLTGAGVTLGVLVIGLCEAMGHC
ncbi:hypothetical protein [Aurantivibrio infirmus]